MIVHKLRHATDTVAAHLRFAAVGVVHAHTGVGLVGRTDQDQTITADAEMAVADGAAESRRIVRHRLTKAIDIDVIVAAAVELPESHRYYFLSSLIREGEGSAWRCSRCLNHAPSYFNGSTTSLLWLSPGSLLSSP